MTTALITHADCVMHETPSGHPEQIARIEAIWNALSADEFATLQRHDAQPAPREALLRAHSEAHLQMLDSRVPKRGAIPLDPDTWLSPESLRVANLGAGAVIQAVDLVLDGQVGAAFCAMRPPGHHAERDRAMGFCLYSNAAIGALHAIEARGLARAAVVDFDVHHGNGTQDIFERDGRVFYGSSHQWPFYPGTGGANETGVGNIANLPLPAMTGSDEFRAGFARTILPQLESFAPELVIISAGFDAHRADPLAQLLLEEDDFAWATEEICAISGRVCEGRVVSTLEGGYDLAALGRSTAAHVRALMAHAAG